MEIRYVASLSLCTFPQRREEKWWRELERRERGPRAMIEADMQIDSSNLGAYIFK